MKRLMSQKETTLVNAYADGELDLANCLVIEEQMSRNPMLAAEYRRIAALQRLLRKRLPHEMASPRLRTRVEELVGMRPRRLSWRTLVASIAATAVTATISTALVLALAPIPLPPFREAVIAAHIRSLMAPHPFDIASSDRHTVKPWFNGRTAQLPRTVDLAEAGFPLIGARVDVIGQTAVPTLVYGHAEHLVSLTTVPAPGRARSIPQTHAAGGYNMMNWTDEGVAYWAVSDIGYEALRAFTRSFRSKDES
jgi:anti-sigma factor RsiW